MTNFDLANLETANMRMRVLVSGILMKIMKGFV